MKCYYLVFNFKNKINNIGFMIFTILIFANIPLFIYYFISNNSSVKKFIISELIKFDYFYNCVNPVKKDNKKLILATLKNNKKQTKIKLTNDKKEMNRSKKNITENNIENDFITKSLINSSKTVLFDLKKIHKDNKISKKNINQKILLVDYKIYNKNYIKMNTQNISKNITKKLKKVKLDKNVYSLIQINTNYSSIKNSLNFFIILDNYEYDVAIKSDDRSFCRIFLYVF